MNRDTGSRPSAPKCGPPRAVRHATQRDAGARAGATSMHRAAHARTLCGQAVGAQTSRFTTSCYSKRQAISRTEARNRRHVRDHHTAVRHMNPTTERKKHTLMPTCTIHGRLLGPTDRPIHRRISIVLHSITPKLPLTTTMGGPNADSRRAATAYLTLPPTLWPTTAPPPSQALFLFSSILG